MTNNLFEYETIENTIKITGINTIPENGNIIIPAEIDGKPVKYIFEKAFYGCTGIIAVIIPNSVTKIGGWAFSDCVNLKSIIIPSSVTKIKAWSGYKE